MRKYVIAVLTLFGFTLPFAANAALIASFSQNASPTPTVTATDNGTVTNITVSGASTTITTGASGIIPNAFFSLNASSVDAATTIGGNVVQDFDGTFCLTSAAGCGGINYLSGVFTDAAFGALGGPGLTVNVSNPPEQLTLTSDVVAANRLQPPSTFDLAFANLSPALHIDGSTIGAFTADFAGDVSATVVEPTSLAILGIGMVGLGLIRQKNKGNTTNYA
jgi:hypothetical protein